MNNTQNTSTVSEKARKQYETCRMTVVPLSNEDVLTKSNDYIGVTEDWFFGGEE